MGKSSRATKNPAGASAVDIQDEQEFVRVDRRRIRRLIRRILRDAGAPTKSVSLAVVDGRTIAELNRRHLGRAGITDVIAFPLGERDCEGRQVLGEVVVCAQLAEREGKLRGINPGRELELYVAHGVLHLVGYDDGSHEQRARMRDAERRYVGFSGE